MLHFNSLGATFVFIGIVTGITAWCVLALVLGNNSRATGISSFVGMAATSVVDVLYRVVNHREKGLVRLVHADCGGCYLTIPVWGIGLMLSTSFG